jgi:peptide/nickel transport system permease protein
VRDDGGAGLRAGPLSRARRWVRSNAAAAFGLVLLGLILGVAVAGPVVYRTDPWERVGRRFEPPAGRFALGTDHAGRDVLAGLVNGARTSLLVGGAAAAVMFVIGVTVGATAGYRGGAADETLMRITEFFQILPAFLFAMVLVAIFTPRLVTIILAIGVSNWPGTARLVRAEFLSLRERDYVAAARALGAGDVRIIVREILPNALPPIVVNASLTVGTAILFEAGLSFLGLADPNVMSWGYMIGASRLYLREAWWTVTLPGVAILAAVLSLSLFGDWLNDVLNPRLREQRAIP